ncbi:hypothetical protein E0504_39980 [Parafrankia sp. BMG5.11]|nr:hypothetical protein E0504_39980 [Parafrankia sp. BMG5.11]SQD99660.1 conserved hypothetical protein [Parafrankia sp. Ea1.12]
MWSRIVTARAGKDGPVAAGGPSIAYVPLVLGLPRPMADALGWTSRPPTWADVMDVLTDPRGWAAHGHPEWGGVTSAIADPARSTEGLATVSALAGAGRGLGREDYLPASAATDPALFDRLRVIQRTRAVRPDDSTGLEAAVARAEAAGPNRIAAGPSIYFMSERAVWKHNRTDPAVPLVVVYPAEGSPAADHPYLLVDRATMPAEARAAAAGFLRFLHSA